jgi:poly(3-hydroxybutyrate) depolymerase
VVATTSPGCNKGGAAADFAERKLASGRNYYVVTPANYDPARPYHVMVAFHGWYSNAKAFHDGFMPAEKMLVNGEMDGPKSPNTFVVFANAADGTNGQWNWSADLGYFDELIAAVGTEYCVNPSKVFAWGHSYGGKFLNELGCRRAGYVKAIGIANGSDGSNYQGCGRLPVIFTHRTRDPEERIGWAKGAWARWQGVNECTGPVAPSPLGMGCEMHTSCKAPGAGVFCTETWDGLKDVPGYQPDWEHGPQPGYVKLAYDWFAALP